jgi:hypothetical protein
LVGNVFHCMISAAPRHQFGVFGRFRTIMLKLEHKRAFLKEPPSNIGDKREQGDETK